MNSTETLRNYKHDIAGKFKDISMAISELDESSFSDPEAQEIFHAVHEVILKMVKTSKRTIANSLNQEITLVVTDVEPNLDLPKLQLEGIVVRYENKGSLLRYLYSKLENHGPVETHLEVLKTLLPFKSIILDGERE
jgi:hypothetical protein